MKNYIRRYLKKDANSSNACIRRDRRIIVLTAAWKEGIRHPNANLRFRNRCRCKDVW